jgi:ribA/ribD-fused uncharacterized protein
MIDFMEHPQEIRFYRATGKYGFLSNLFKTLLIFEHKAFPHAEAAYQYGKPKDKETAEWLILAPKPHLCATTAHALLSYDIRKDWDTIKVDRMKRVLHAKFFDNLGIRVDLLNTGDAILIEESKTDAFWGIGKKGNGKNMLGILLMELREEIRKDPHWGKH